MEDRILTNLESYCFEMLMKFLKTNNDAKIIAANFTFDGVETEIDYKGSKYKVIVKVED
ncbi:MAG: hypothetical protein QXP60_05685 [Nitrososphaerota archaeon]